jgi:SAM-dependent methyltransferase
MKIIDLGIHPFSDTFIPKSRLTEAEPVYPLVVALEKNGYIHLTYPTTDRYNLYDYSYTSSNSEFSKNHWLDFGQMLFDRSFVKKGSKVLEIGSNDGFLIGELQKRGCKVLGIDASHSMSLIANKNGVKTIDAFFGSGSASNFKSKFGKFDLIIANNVLNHADDPDDFVKGVAKLLGKNGIFVYELPYWMDTVTSGHFDQIYHEHRTYFTVYYSYNLLKGNGMEILNVEKVNYHGGSIRVFAKLKGDVIKTKIVSEFIKREKEAGLFIPKTYKKYMDNILNAKFKLLKKIYSVKEKGFKIVAVGAAAKANTFLNFYKLDAGVVDCITDASPLKIGKYMPMSRIPIKADAVLKNYQEVYVLILTWNLNLQNNLLKINPKIKFLKL